MTERNYKCPAPFTSICYHTDGTMAPCGFVLPSQQLQPIEDYKNIDFIKNIKQDMLENKRNAVCNHCFNLEDNNLITHRLFFERAAGLKNNSIEEFTEKCVNQPIKFVELKFSNLCNFKCRICYPQISSSIASEEIKFNKDFTAWKTYNRPSVFDSSKKDFLLEEIKSMSKHLECIAFTGGEPTLNWQHWECLDYLIENNYKPKLIYFTNGSVLEYKNQHIFDKWKHFKDIEFKISIDAIGEQAEYWRPGEPFNVIVENIKSIRQNMPHVKIGFTLTWAWPILYRIKETFELLSSLVPDPHIAFSYVNKKQYDVRVLPSDYKEKFKNEITHFLNTTDFNKEQTMRKDIENVLAYTLAEDWSNLLEESLADISKYDKRRNEDFVSVFPEFTELVEKYGRK